MPKLANLQAKVERFELFQKKTMKTIEDIENGMNFANAEGE